MLHDCGQKRRRAAECGTCERRVTIRQFESEETARDLNVIGQRRCQWIARDCSGLRGKKCTRVSGVGDGACDIRKRRDAETRKRRQQRYVTEGCVSRCE